MHDFLKEANTSKREDSSGSEGYLKVLNLNFLKFCLDPYEDFDPENKNSSKSKEKQKIVQNKTIKNEDNNNNESGKLKPEESEGLKTLFN